MTSDPAVTNTRGPSRDPSRRVVFGRMLGASGISSIGDGVRLVALPLLAASLTRDPVDIALVAACAQLPWLVAPLLGVVVDRARPLHLMTACDVLRATVAGVLTLMVALDHASVLVLAAASLALGVSSVLADSAAQVLVPSLVADEELERGNSRVFAVQTLSAQMLGPVLGAWLAGVGLALPFGLDAVTFVASAGLLLSVIRWNRPPPPRSADGGLLREMSAGARWAVRDPLMRALIAVVFGLSFIDGAVGGILVLFALQNLGLSAGAYGLLLAAAAGGAVIGTLTAPRLRLRWGQRPVLVGSALLAGLSYVAMALWQDPIVAAFLLAAHACGVMWWNVLSVAARQRAIPGELLGRVTTLYRMAAWGATPLGTLLGGLLAREVGVSRLILGAGAALALIACGVFRIPETEPDRRT